MKEGAGGLVGVGVGDLGPSSPCSGVRACTVAPW